MSSAATYILPQTHALERYIQASVDQLLTRGDRVPGDGLLFLGNWHDAMPRLIFQDPVLQPVDTRIWGVIKIAASGAGPTAFPTYRRIAACANVGSDATVARSMAILRATRWLSLCRRVRDSQGRFRGNVYALHDEPLPLPDALHLDQEYMPFLEQACTHNHPQVRKVAAAVLATITEDLRWDPPLLDTENSMERRLVAMKAVDDNDHRFFAFSSRQLQNLKLGQHQASLQNLKARPLQKLKCDRSSSYIYQTTTTTGRTPPPAQAREAQASTTLGFPSSLSPNERRLAELCLRDAPASVHQDLLDEWAGRLLSARHKNRPIENPIGYLAKLCNAAREGTFTLTSLGLKTREHRDRSATPPGNKDLSDTEALASRRAMPGARAQSSRSPLPDTRQAGDGSAIGSSGGPKNPRPVREHALAAMHAAVGRAPQPDTGHVHTDVSLGDSSTITSSPGAEPSEHRPPLFESDGTAIGRATGPPIEAPASRP